FDDAASLRPGISQSAAEALQHGALRLLELQEQWFVIRGEEQSDATKRADRPDANCLEHEVLQREAVEQSQAIRRKILPICGGDALKAQAVLSIGLGMKVEDCRRLLDDLHIACADQMREIVVPRETLAARLPNHAGKLASQATMRDPINLIFQIDAAVPDLEWRQFRQRSHVRPISSHGRSGIGTSMLLRCARTEGRDRDAGGEALDVDGEIDARQGFVE